MKTDLVVGVAGALVLVGALVGVWFTADGGDRTLRQYEIQWREDGVQPVTINGGNLPPGSTAVQSLPAFYDNMTTIRITLTWRDDPNTAPDVFALTLIDKWGVEVANGTSDQGVLTLETNLTMAPSHITHIDGRDPQDAQARLHEYYGTSYGAGLWTARVHAVEAGGIQDPVLGRDLVPDEVTDYSLDMTVWTYAGEVAE